MIRRRIVGTLLLLHERDHVSRLLRGWIISGGLLLKLQVLLLLLLLLLSWGQWGCFVRCQGCGPSGCSHVPGENVHRMRGGGA